MLTTNLDGLWLLQVLSGIEVLAPELGLRPHLPSIETPEIALSHPVASELRQAGVIDADGAVDETVREWLTVLSRRDMALLLFAQTPATYEYPERVLIARFAQWWVSLERCGTRVRLSGAGTASSGDSASRLINSEIERLCGRMPPAAIKPLTIDRPDLLTSVRDADDLRSFLRGNRFDSDQIALLTLAADGTRSAQASIVAIQSGTANGPARSHVEPASVTIIDTPQGRLVSEQVRHGDKSWLILSPGGPAAISYAVLAMIRSLPANEQWHSHRKVV